MRLALDAVCQLVLFYETFKSLKAAPLPRKRRNMTDEPAQDVAKPSSYAKTLRSRRVKTMLRAWVIYTVFAQAEKAIYAIIGRWLPLYSVLRLICLAVYIWGHKQLSDHAFSTLLKPAIKPYERILDPLAHIVSEILDISVYLIALLLSYAAKPFMAIFRTAKSGYQWLRPVRALSSTKAYVAAADTSALTSFGSTPKPRRRTKTRLSERATPHAPGHLVITADDLHASIASRDLWPEASTDSMPAFREALDRAQAAFYEAESPEQIRGKKQHLQGPKNVVISSTAMTDATAALKGRDMKSRRMMTHSNTMQALAKPNEGIRSTTRKTRIATSRSRAVLSRPSATSVDGRDTARKRTAETAALRQDTDEPAPKRRLQRTTVQLPAMPVAYVAASTNDRQLPEWPSKTAGDPTQPRSTLLVRANSIDRDAHSARQSALAARRGGRAIPKSNGVG